MLVLTEDLAAIPVEEDLVAKQASEIPVILQKIWQSDQLNGIEYQDKAERFESSIKSG